MSLKEMDISVFSLDWHIYVYVIFTLCIFAFSPFASKTLMLHSSVTQLQDDKHKTDCIFSKKHSKCSVTIPSLMSELLSLPLLKL